MIMDTLPSSKMLTYLEGLYSRVALHLAAVRFPQWEPPQMNIVYTPFKHCRRHASHILFRGPTVSCSVLQETLVWYRTTRAR